MHILPVHRVLFTIASHFLNFPPKTLHAIVVLNANPSLSKSSGHDCKSFLKLPPQSPTCNGIPECTSFPFIEFFSRLQVIFRNSSLPRFRNSRLPRFRNSRLPRFRNSRLPRFRNSSLPPIQTLHRVLVTIPNHFLNFPPKTLHAICISPQCKSLPLIEFLSPLQVIS